MKTFKQFIDEGTYPTWVRASSIAIVLRIRSLSKKIETETDPSRQARLIGVQNRLISYLVGMGLAVGASDNDLLRRLGARRGQ